MRDLLKDHFVEVGFITCTDEILGFIDFWKLLCETLEIESQSFFELLLYRILIRLWNIYSYSGHEFESKKKELEILLFGDPPNFLKLHQMDFDSIRSHFQEPQPPLSESSGKDKLKQFFNKTIWDMKKYSNKFVIPGKGSYTAKIDARSSPKYLSWLVDLIPEKEQTLPTCWDQIKDPNKSNPFLKTDGDVFKFFAWAKETFEWAEGKPLIFLIAIDEILSPITKLNDPSAWKKLGTLFVTMRGHLKYVLWVLIDTEEEWNEYDQAIQKKSDLQSQIGGFINNKIVLNPLSIEEMKNVLKKRVELFWEGTNQPILQHNPIAPFTDEAFEYIIHYYNRKLRNCIKACDSIWGIFKNQEKVSKFLDYYQTFNLIRRKENNLPVQDTFTISSLHPFEINYLIKQFWSQVRFSTEGVRSEYIEVALWKAFLLLKQDESQVIGEAKHNRQKTQLRRPDVLVPFFENEGPIKTLLVEYQVKMYSESELINKEVPSGELDSSIELLTNHSIDALHIITTIPLSKSIKKKLEPFKERIISYQPINNHQLVALICFQDFNSLFNRTLTIIETKSLLQIIFNKPWDIYIEDLRLIQSGVEKEKQELGVQIIDENLELEPVQTDLNTFVARNSEGESNLSNQTQTTQLIENPPDDQLNLSQSQPPYIEEIVKVDPKLEKCEIAFIYAMQRAYNNKKIKNSIALTTLNKNHPSDISSSDLKKIFSISKSRFHSIPNKTQNFSITTDGRAFLEKYNLHQIKK